MLTKQIVDWYADRGLLVDKMRAVSDRKRISFDHFKMALVHCHSKIKEGKIIPDSDIFRYVINIAKGFASEGIEAPDESIVHRAQDEINKEKKETQKARQEAAGHKRQATMHKERENKLAITAKKFKGQIISLGANFFEIKNLLTEEKIKNKRLKFKAWCLLFGFVLSSVAALFLTYVYVWGSF